jgi:cytochrome c oxidase subunit 5a
MASSILRIAARGSTSTFFRANTVARSQPLAARAGLLVPSLLAANSFSTTTRMRSEHHEESFEEFTARYEKEFEGVNDVFELQVRSSLGCI